MSRCVKIICSLFFLTIFFSIFTIQAYAKTTISVPHLKQLPELPRGCEVTSLAMMLQHAGVKVGKLELAKEVRKVPFQTNGRKGNPYDGFVGSMYSLSSPGLGVYHGPIYDMANKYLPNRVVDLSGNDFSYIYSMLDKGMPVWVITNSWFSQLPASQFTTWQTNQGSLKITYREHSVLITGYDANYIYINDPLFNKPNRAVNKKSFIAAWNQMGKQAISYYPKNANWFIDTIHHPYNSQIQQMASLGLYKSLKNGFYQPDRAVQRLEAKQLFTKLAEKKANLKLSNAGKLTRGELSQYIVTTFDVPNSGKVSFSDVPSNHKAFTAIQSVVSSKIIPTTSNGSFKPNQPATKAELAAAITKAMNLYWYKDTYNHWARDEISYLKRKGIVGSISPAQFGPNEPITREQAAVIIDRALKLKVTPFKKLSFTDVLPTDPTYTAIAKMVQLGFIDGTQSNNGIPSFQPKKPLNRNEMAQLFSRSFSLPSPEKPIAFKDVNTKSEYYSSIQALGATRVISTSGDFNPKNSLTRAQFASILAKLMQR